jgi:hypothetical protein
MRAVDIARGVALVALYLAGSVALAMAAIPSP